MSWEAELAARLYSKMTYKPSKIGQTDLDFGSNQLIYCLACKITSLYTIRLLTWQPKKLDYHNTHTHT